MKDISAIDWQSLGATEVSRWLHDLQSEDGYSDVYDNSFRSLDQFLVPHYPTREKMIELMRNEAHHNVIPFLIDIVENDPSKVASMVDLMDTLVRCWYNREFFAESDPNRVIFERWSQRNNDAVRVGLPIYQRLLNNSSGDGKEMFQSLLDALEATMI